MPQTERQRKDSDGMKRNPVCEQMENRQKEAEEDSDRWVEKRKTVGQMYKRKLKTCKK